MNKKRKGFCVVLLLPGPGFFELCCLQEQNELLSAEHELCSDARQTHQGTGFLSTLPADFAAPRGSGATGVAVCQ